MKVVTIDPKIHKRLKLISTLTEKSMKSIAFEALDEILKDMLEKEIRKYIEADG